ncbi:MAG: glycoside hydrolase family 3 C-terminal domain-containing protein [Clostridiales bacterium]|nr:glycoside hydrolase family 3 C-terminal domain-containing protein [Clostridiales bacterium]
MGNEKKTQKRMGNKVFAGIWGTILAILLVAVLVGNYFAMKYATIITRSLGHTTTEVVSTGEGETDSEYFKSAYDSHDDLVAYETEFSQQLEAEGVVLLKNSDDILPMESGQKITLFGIGSAKFLYSGGGSGAIDTTNVMSLKEALEAEGFEVNPEIWSMYESSENRVEQEISVDDYSSDVVDSIEEYSDAAIIVISRSAQEAMDLEEEELVLSDEEMEMVNYANANFDNIVVLLNTANAIEMGWADSQYFPNIKAVIWTGYPGQEGISSIAKVLTGEVNPSGRLVDTYAYDSLSAPATQIFGAGQWTNTDHENSCKNYYTVYGESIYVGYRYYETRYEDTVLGQGNASTEDSEYVYSDEVQYPFGYGLSYTEFSYSDFSLTENEDSFTVEVTVTNEGNVAGKEVVEVYFQSPYTDYDRENLVEKSSVELCGFAKTAELAPGESETVSVEVDKEELRAYDYMNAKTYIVDEGTYYFTVGSDCHVALNNILAAKGYSTDDGMDADGDASMTGTYEQDELDTTTYSTDADTGTEITNQFDNGSITYYDDSYVYLSRNDWEGTWPVFYGEADEKGNYTMTATDEIVEVSQYSTYEDDPDAEMPTTDSGENINLITMRGKDYDDEGWDAVLDCLTVDEMMEMVRLGGWQTMAIDSISKPMSSDQDGPAGISGELIMSDVDCMGYPNQEVLAATWNTELALTFGECIGEDGLAVGVQGWYAPGAGTHRTPLGGRNYEYYSEDAFLSGAMCASEVEGAQSKGMYCYLKHLVLNDQEIRRYGVSAFVTEQALRELYLTPFEMAVKDADCHGMMAAFNGIGGVWCGSNEALLTEVLTNEWGFHGIVVTDYATANTGYMLIDAGLQAGADLWLNTDSEVYKLDDVANNATLVTALRNASHDILYTVVNSSAMNGIDENVEVRKVLPLWQKWLIAFDVAMAVVILGSVLLIVRRCRKNTAKVVLEETKKE